MATRENNAWLMKPVAKCNVDELTEIHQMMQFMELLSGDGTVMPKRRADLVQEIEEGRRRYWDNQQGKPAKAKRSIAGISATEVNEWLATLPPWPLHGEAADA